jgi:hypothetical protein
MYKSEAECKRVAEAAFNEGLNEGLRMGWDGNFDVGKKHG